MVKAGEESGTLDIVLKNLSEFLEREKELKDKVTSSLIYPLFMISVSFILIFFVFVFVFPRITTIFQEQKLSLPLITKIFIAISSMLFNYWYVLIIVVVLLFFILRLVYRKKRSEISRFLFEMPLHVLRNLYITRFARILSLLLGGGVPIVKALEYVKDVSGNIYLSSEIERVKDEVKEGNKVSDVATFLPPLYLQMIMTGERTGDLVGSLYKISDMAEREFKKSVDSFLKMLEPAIILTMGVAVGFMVLSILLPIFQMNQVIR
jgi:general secretion pathway protein F